MKIDRDKEALPRDRIEAQESIKPMAAGGFKTDLTEGRIPVIRGTFPGSGRVR